LIEERWAAARGGSLPEARVHASAALHPAPDFGGLRGGPRWLRRDFTVSIVTSAAQHLFTAAVVTVEFGWKPEHESEQQPEPG